MRVAYLYLLISDPDLPGCPVNRGPGFYEPERPQKPKADNRRGSIPGPLIRQRRYSWPTPQQARKWQESIENVLSDPKGRAFFHKFLQNEYASENLDFWNSVKELKKNNPSGERLKKDVRQIHEQYLRDSAENLINVNNRLKGAIKDCLDDPGLEIFDEAQRVVYGLMKEGAYQRFIEESHIQTLIREVPSLHSSFSFKTLYQLIRVINLHQANE
eukprot:sb/3470049/